MNPQHSTFPASRRAGRVYQASQFGRKSRSRHRPTAQRLEMRRLLLAIDQGYALALQQPDEASQRDFGRVRATRKHGLAEENLPERQPVQSADQFAVLPGFNG